jgi:hypothetical protein
MADPMIQCNTDKIACARGRGVQRVEFFLVQEAKSGSGGHIDNGCFASNYPEMRGYFSAEGVAGFGGETAAMQALNEQITRIVTSVTDGETFSRETEPALLQTLQNGTGGSGGGQAVLEGVGSDQDVHRFTG